MSIYLHWKLKVDKYFETKISFKKTCIVERKSIFIIENSESIKFLEKNPLIACCLWKVEPSSPRRYAWTIREIHAYIPSQAFNLKYYENNVGVCLGLISSASEL